MANKSDEMICLLCSLPICDEFSKHCLYQLAGKPASRKVRKKKLKTAIETLKEQLAKAESRLAHIEGDGSRQMYFRFYYAKNRDKKLAMANDRHKRKKGE